MNALADAIALGAAAVAILNMHIARTHAVAARESARAALASERRAAELLAAEDHLEVDRGLMRIEPLRIVSAEETLECLVNDAVRRHPAGRAR